MAGVGPWYPMYGSDFDRSTAAWSLEASGAYVRLMNHQWGDGFIPDDPAGVASILRVPPAKARSLWWIVEQKFPVVGPGRRANWRLAELREQREEWNRKSSEGGKRGAASRAAKREPPYEPPLQPPLEHPYQGKGQPNGNNPDPYPSGSESSSSSPQVPCLGGIREGLSVHADRLAAKREEIEWRTAECWRVHLVARERHFVAKNGKVPQPPELTSETRKAIAAALKEHDSSRLAPEDRERWKRESPVRAAGIGIFLSSWHTGANPRSDGPYLEPWRPWKHQKGKPDPVPSFAHLYFAEKG